MQHMSLLPVTEEGLSQFMNRLFRAMLLFAAIGSVPILVGMENDPSAEKAVIAFQGETVNYAGKITDTNVERFLAEATGKNVSTLVISSGGGEINAGMRMGEWVLDNHVDVVVKDMCMSSCANYVFTAGRRKTINANSIVAWHGNIFQEYEGWEEDVRKAATETFDKLSETDKKKQPLKDMIQKALEQMRLYRAASIKKQSEFFKKIGVDGYICRIGNEEYGARDFFILSVKDMARFGVLNVSAPEKYEETDLTRFRRKGKSVEFISLR